MTTYMTRHIHTRHDSFIHEITSYMTHSYMYARVGDEVIRVIYQWAMSVNWTHTSAPLLTLCVVFHL